MRIANKNIIMSSFKSRSDIQKKDGWARQVRKYNENRYQMIDELNSVYVFKEANSNKLTLHLNDLKKKLFLHKLVSLQLVLCRVAAGKSLHVHSSLVQIIFYFCPLRSK